VIDVERERWKRLSPLLDGLLDLEPEQRALRLEALRREDAQLAGELAALLANAGKADDAQFLSGTAETPADLEPPPASLAGERVGAYVLEAALGQGGAGVVWRARRADGRFEGAVAFKLLHLSLLGHAGALRFEREGAILARLAHPNIASLLDAGVTPAGQPYLVLELVEGERVDLHCDAQQLTIENRVMLFRDVLGAVAHAHRHLVVHRDIKPSNILVTRDGRVKLLDFGIAKLLQGEGDGDAATQLTREGGRALTPEYAAPEQLRGDEVTTTTDVYSLGVLLFQLLAGRHPTAPDRATLAEVIQATLVSEPGRLTAALTSSTRMSAETLARIARDRDTSVQSLRRELRGDLETIVAKALRKSPAERYTSVDVFSEDLRRWLAGEPVTARPPTWAYRASRFVSRHRGAVAAAAFTFAAIIAGLVGTFTQARRAEQQSERAQHEAETARLQRDEALQQQVMLRGNNEFLQLLMRDAAGQEPGAIRKQLDRASELIEKTAFERPVVKVALLRQIAARYAELGDVATGARLLRRALESIVGTDLAAPGSSVPINLACSLAFYLQDGEDLAGAAAELDRVDRMLASGVELSVPSRVECRMARSYVDSGSGHLERGVAVARDALQRLEAAGIRTGEQHRIVRSAVARALLDAGHNTEALAVAQPLLEESTAAQGRASMAVLRRSNLVTRTTLQGGQALAALALSQADEDSVTQLLGPERHDARIDLLHGQVLFALNRDVEATAMLLRSAAAAREGGVLEIVLPAELTACEALLRQGKAVEARQLFMESTTIRAQALRGGWTIGVEALRVEALLARADGDPVAADRLLDSARTLADAVSAPGHDRDFGIALSRGEMALGTPGSPGATPRTALAEADRALATARRAALQADRSSDVGRALLLRARSLAALGQQEVARGVAESARLQLEATLGGDNAQTRSAAALANGA
jgi:serine/threonine protein kinase